MIEARDIARFLSKVRSIPAPAWLDGRGDCLEWLGSRDRKGYGKFWAHDFPGFDGRPRRDGTRNGAMVCAHRFAVVAFFGIGVLRELHGDHLCLRPFCANPLHVVPATVSENTARGNVTRWSVRDPFAELGW